MAHGQQLICNNFSKKVTNQCWLNSFDNSKINYAPLCFCWTTLVLWNYKYAWKADLTTTTTTTTTHLTVLFLFFSPFIFLPRKWRRLRTSTHNQIDSNHTFSAHISVIITTSLSLTLSLSLSHTHTHTHTFSFSHTRTHIYLTLPL